MYKKIIRSDILKSKAITLTTVMFIAAAAMLVSLAAILFISLTGAMANLMTQAKTPHFLQMHLGEVDLARLSSFAAQNSNVQDYQTVPFLNIDGAQIVLGGNSLAVSVQDNGLSVQSSKFDFLLDLDSNIIEVSDGEIYVPIIYMRDGTAKAGDRAVISGKEFTVAGFLRDSQMNSSLSASKRFLVSPHDYEQMKRLGAIEYLIEFRLKDAEAISALEADYTSAGLEANGPTVTYRLFKTMNALSDGMMIGVILVVSALVVIIAFMCTRFTLLAKIEDDYREIGVMKAIGLRVWDIKKSYLVKYAAIAAAGCVLGFALSLLFKENLLENIRLYMGKSENSSSAFILGIIGILMVFFSIIAYVSSVLKRFGKISAAEAIRFGVSQGKKTGTKYFSLKANRLLSTNVFLGVKDVLTRKGLYLTMLMVLVIAVFIMIVPQNLYNTISSESFTKYMGIGNYDMHIQLAGQEAQKAKEISKTMIADSDISKYSVLTTKIFRSIIADGTEENIKVELGDHAIFPIKYSQGKAPASESEIALSGINAKELSKKVGDTLILMLGGERKTLIVSGIYSDITNGGKTAKANFTDNSADVVWSVICAAFTDKSLADKKNLEYADKFPFAKISDIDEFVKQTFGSITNAVKISSYAAAAIALTITALVTLLFMKLLIAKDRYAIAVMRSFGFTNSDIKTQYISRSVFILILGILLGTLLANTLGEGLAGMIISSFGASSFDFIVNPLSAYLLSPLLITCLVLAATVMGTMGAGQIKIAENIKE
ncbi:MAG: FtsX-like permease family protein [Clostridiales bacterium]|nr:FtsX-like permease family protein [Clostridiales bacterium]